MNRPGSTVWTIAVSTLLSIATTVVTAATTYSVSPLPRIEAGLFENVGNAIGPTGIVVGRADQPVWSESQVNTAVLWDEAGTLHRLVPNDEGESQAYDINGRGQVLVYSDGPFFPSGAYIWSNGALTAVNLGVSLIATGRVLALNDASQIMGTGFFKVGTGTQQRAFLATNGVTTDLGVLPGATASWANGLNNNGDVVGYSFTSGGQQRAVLWRNGNIVDLGVLAGQSSSIANDINDLGQIVGTSGDRLFLWENGVMRDLGKYSEETFVRARAINNRGEIIGAIGTAGRFSTSSFLWKDGRFNDIGPVLQDGRRCTVGAINDAGQISASCYYVGETYVMTPTTAATDLGVNVYASSYPGHQDLPHTLNFEVSNVGALDATNVQLIHDFPANASFISSSTNRGACGNNGVRLVCSLGNLASGDRATVQLTVVSNAIQLLEYYATVSSAETETNTANNIGYDRIYIVAAPADLGVSMSSSSSTIKRLSEFTYVINIRNDGPGNAANITATDSLPSSMSLVSTHSSQGSCSGTTTIRCNLGTIANGRNATVNIVVQPRVRGTFSNSVSVSSTNPDSHITNNRSAVTVTVR